MTFLIEYTNDFRKSYKSLTDKEQNQVDKKVAILVEDPSYPSLRAKHLKGKVDLFEFSVNMNIRVIWRYKNGKIILLLAVGKHDILKKWG